MVARRISIEIDDHLQEELDRLARDTGRTREQIVRDALEQLVRAEEVPSRESAYEMAKRLGFLGCIKGLPPDLSTNPKYMEGFGE